MTSFKLQSIFTVLKCVVLSVYLGTGCVQRLNSNETSPGIIPNIDCDYLIIAPSPEYQIQLNFQRRGPPSSDARYQAFEIYDGGGVDDPLLLRGIAHDGNSQEVPAWAAGSSDKVLFHSVPGRSGLTNTVVTYQVIGKSVYVTGP